MTGISLAKGTSLSLKKADGTELVSVRLGLGWDAVPKKKLFGFGGGGDVDLDASALLFNGAGKCVDTVYYGHLTSKDRAVSHSGDNLTGDGDGDDEVINVNLTQVSSDVKTIVFVITSYSGQTFDEVKNVFARIVDASTGQETVRYNLAESSHSTGLVIAKVTRNTTGWDFAAIGEFVDNARTPNKMVDPAARFV